MGAVLCYSLSISLEIAPLNRKIRELQKRSLLFFLLKKVVVIKIFCSELTCLLPYLNKLYHIKLIFSNNFY